MCFFVCASFGFAEREYLSEDYVTACIFFNHFFLAKSFSITMKSGFYFMQFQHLKLPVKDVCVSVFFELVKWC